ncbi:MAG TPA: hypothetical protein VG944_20700 [Fimbriimonas sp.]|nr:hypothetical protein [Fimbriimonas sp.]
MLGAVLLMGLLGALDLPPYHPDRPRTDWLLRREPFHAQLFRGSGKDEIVLSNGLVSRTFRLSPDMATVRLDNLMTGESLLRTVEPEGFLTIDGAKIAIGGLTGQPDRAYLTPEWLDAMKPVPGAMRYESLEVGKPAERVPWVRKRHGSPNAVWPPPGVAITFHFSMPEGKYKGLSASVRYELYDGIPLISKSISVENGTMATFKLDSFVNERLGMVESESVVDTPNEWMNPPITIATDYSFGGMAMSASNRTTYWETDPDYTTQVNYNLQTPCLLETHPPLGPGLEIAPGKKLQSFHTFELIHDSSDRERRGLAVRKMFRTLAPWCTENPIMLHLTSTDPQVVKTAIDQAADAGFEMIIFSFGSGLDMEDVSAANIAKFKEFHDYAKSKGLEMGGYSLLASRHIDDKNDAINPKTGKPGGAIFGYSPCLGSEWGESYFKHLKTFLSETHFDLLENDGSYPGDVCASTAHPGHKGLEDSQWTQFNAIADFYRWCRQTNVYLNVPDNYFFSGSNKTGMGYRETNWSLPRAQQHIHARQNLYDGTWEKTPSMGWMMVPLVEYQGGGAAATIEPLKEHLQDYGLHLANNFGYGAQACYRGPRLYDSPETRGVVKGWVDWFKKYRDILESDVIHVRRADGVHLDTVLHVNPRLAIKAMAVVYNPTDEPLTENVILPLYYSGIEGTCSIEEEHGVHSVKLDANHSITLRPTVGPRSCNWYVIR